MVSDERLHCPYCKWSTQLANKFERHLEKKHAEEIEFQDAADPADEEE